MVINKYDKNAVYMRKNKNVYTILIRKTQGTYQLADPLRRWEHNTEMNFMVMDCTGAKLIEMTQDRAQRWASVNTVTNNLV
jgi:hypothetical protein